MSDWGGIGKMYLQMKRQRWRASIYKYANSSECEERLFAPHRNR